MCNSSINELSIPHYVINDRIAVVKHFNLDFFKNLTILSRDLLLISSSQLER